MKKLLPLCLAALAITSLKAETKVMRIYFGDGTSQTITIENVQKIAFEDQGEIITDRMVDMGLSVKWASYNVGASVPEGYGNFYAYGEIEPKDEYRYENYVWRYPDYNDWDCDEWEKYFKLGATITGTQYDVAHMKWGDKWRMPTRAEWNELIDNCSFTWTGINGVTGILATSQITGNSIFFPAAGNMVDEKHTHDQLGCFLWTATEYEQSDISQECRNYRANLDATNHAANGYDYPEVGFNVRAVYGDVPAPEKPQYKVPDDSQMVDLGLSVKWAPFNIGTDSDTRTGEFICWGELLPKQYTHSYNYKFYDAYNDTYEDIADQISDTEYDCAKYLWGNGWRLPTKEEFEELVTRCTWTVSSSGYTVTGPNGNSMFLPACGFMTYKGAPRSSYESGYYMCGDADTRVRPNGEKMLSNCVALKFTRTGYTLNTPVVDYFSKAGGIQVRPVHE